MFNVKAVNLINLSHIKDTLKTTYVQINCFSYRDNEI